MQKIAIFGATGFIGDNTLDVISSHPDQYKVYALTAFNQVEKLISLCLQFSPEKVVVGGAQQAQLFHDLFPSGKPKPDVSYGALALVELAQEPDSFDTMVAAIVGIAGLPSVFEAARNGKRILLANKEALVAAGSLFMQCVQDNQATLLPIDSEHNAILQCLSGSPSTAFKRLILTASGGPFRTTALEDLQHVTPSQACAHPNWAMGRKISVDSATMFNKGLEVIEAKWLFDCDVEQINVLVHPQSLVHSMVEFDDGSLIAQMGVADMRVPISYSLAHPQRLRNNAPAFNLSQLSQLDFAPVCPKRFASLGLAYAALDHSQGACIVLNAANEIAVANFLDGKIGFLNIVRNLEYMLNWYIGQPTNPVNTLADVLELDQNARAHLNNKIGF